MLDTHYQQIRELIQRVRRRWRTLRLFQATVRAALAASAVLCLALLLARWTDGAPLVLAVLGGCALVLAVAAAVWGLRAIRHVPSDTRVARFIEERTPALEDRLASAVDLAGSERQTAPPVLAEPMLADAARRSQDVDPTEIVAARTLRRGGLAAAAATLLLVSIAFLGRERAREAYDAGSLALFPARVTLDVSPGNTRIKAGTALAIEAHLVGNRAPVVPQVQIADGDRWRATEMGKDAAGNFRLALDSVGTSFTYRVTAAGVISPTFTVTVARVPRVARIDVDYAYPAALGLAPRTEEDSGDIYAPAGTTVRVRIHTDRPVATGQMALGGGTTLGLTADSSTVFSGTLTVVEDTSYRVALDDGEGLTSPGETEYFIRTLEDRAPDVRITKPARDRNVTRLEEVDIEASADDDYGVERMELVYAVRGSAEKVVALPVPQRATSVSGRHTLYLEDLNVQPGDFVSYYVRARDLARGKRSSEARSDIFFLEVKPFEQEFVLAQSQAMSGSGANRSIDDLVTAQKEIVVATWKLDRRAQNAKGARSEQDIRSVGRAEGELKERVEQTSSSFRESNMRDPRRRQPQGGRGGQTPQPRAGETLPEEDAMTAAALAMGRAVTSLEALKTGDALAPELEALNHLLKAQADVKRREVSRQQAGNGGGNRASQDMSSLFDKELQRSQQTNYETPNTTAQREDANASMLDKIKELARRQDEINRRQEELAKQQLSEAELKRELEKLTREQSELRQRAEELARQAAQQSSEAKQASKDDQKGKSDQSGQRSQSQGQPGQSGANSETGKRMRDISEEMRAATSDLRRQNPRDAGARGSRALDKLRDLERQLQSSNPDERRRALGEMQLESRQLADAQRQVASELGKVAPGEPGKDALRRLAGEEDRLADRMRRLQEGLKQQAAGSAGDKDKDKAAQQAAVGQAARDLERERLAERMQQSAEDLRAASQPGAPGKNVKNVPNDKNGTPDASGKTDEGDKSEAATDVKRRQQDMAAALDKLADKLASATGPRDGESRKLSDQIAKAQELRDRLDSVSREIERLSKQSGQNTAPSGQKSAGQQGGEGQQGGGTGSEVGRLRDEYARQLQQTRELLDEIRRDEPTVPQGGSGFTFEGQGMTLSAPGTEAFKQDFAKWEEMRRHATQALETAQSALSKKLQATESRDRLAAGVDDKAPPGYQKQVDSYFKALAAKKKQ